MKQSLFALLFLITSSFTLLGQTPSLENTLILAEDSPHNVTQAKILGVNKEDSNLSLYYSFIHPGGGVQKVTGSLMSGGKEPTNLTAFGQINIPVGLAPASTPVKWIAQRHASANVNYYAEPLNGATAMTQTPLARKGELAPYDSIRSIERNLIKSSKLSPLSISKGDDEEPSYIPEYYQTIVYVGLSGKISQVATLNYKLKSEEDRNKTFSLGGAYKSETSINKDGVKGIFGADNISFKQTAGDIPKVYDPLTGNAIVMGGIKYKKDKTKENSEYRELRLFAFNKEGEVINSVVYESDEPISIEGAYPIYGKQLAPDVLEITHSVIIARGGGSRKMSGINKKHYRAIIVDIKTGEIVAESQTELTHKLSGVLEFGQLPNGGMQLLYYNVSTGGRGLSLITIAKDGTITEKQFNADSPEVTSLNLPAGAFANLGTKPVYNFPLEDGSELIVKNVFSKVSPAAGQPAVEKTIGLAAFMYDVDGHLKTFRGIGESINVDNFNLLTITENHLIFYEQYKGVEAGRDKIQFISINIETLEVEVSKLPAWYFLPNLDSFFFDTTNHQVFFLTQEKLGKGLYLSKFKF